MWTSDFYPFLYLPHRSIPAHGGDSTLDVGLGIALDQTTHGRAGRTASVTSIVRRLPSRTTVIDTLSPGLRVDGALQRAAEVTFALELDDHVATRRPLLTIDVLRPGRRASPAF